MASVILVGDDSVSMRARRAELSAAANVDPSQVLSYDLSDPEQLYPAFTAIGQPSMFAEPRLIDVRCVEALTAEDAVTLRQAMTTAQHSDTIIVWGTRLAATAKRNLVGIPVETFAAIAGTSRARIARLASEQNIALDDATLEHLDTVTRGDLASAASVLYALTVTGLTSPTPALIDRFAGSATVSAGTAWGVADALAVGDLRTALTLCEGCEPLAVLSYLATRLGQVGRIVETPLTTAAQVAGAFGVPNLTGAQRLLDHAERLGPRGVSTSWTMLANADVAVKRSAVPRMTMDAVLVDLARMWARVTPEVLAAPRPARGLPLGR